MRIPTVEEIQGACSNCEATWNSCITSCKSYGGSITYTSFGHVGSNDSPDLHFHFDWDSNKHDARVRITAPGCSGCRWSHRFYEDQVVLEVCPVPSWSEICVQIVSALEMKVCQDVILD